MRSAAVRVCCPAGAVAARVADEFLDAPTYLVLDPVADNQGGKHNVEVRLDGLALVVVDRSGLQVVFATRKPQSSWGKGRQRDEHQ